MAINKNKLSGGGEVGEAVVKESWLSRTQVKFSSLAARQKIAILIGFSATIIGLIIIIYSLTSPLPSSNDTLIDNQKVDQGAVDRALEQLQKDPSAIPSGEFHPEKSDYFMTENKQDSSIEGAQ